MKREQIMDNKNYYPTKYCISSGIGISEYKLVAFDQALLSSKIGNYNLLKVSSILPMGVELVDHIDIPFGSPLLTAYSNTDSNVPNEKIATAVGVAIPQNPSDIGVIMEYSGHCSAKEAEEKIAMMCKEAMDIRKIKYKEIKISSNEAIVSSDGTYTSLVSAISFW